MNNQTEALIIFIKNAVKGKVKTRLARTVGEERALRIYLALLEHTRRVALSTSASRYLYYSDFIDTTDEWSPHDFTKLVQQGPDLGTRMANAFGEVFRRPDCRRVLIIGSDCVDLNPALLHLAFEKLKKCDFVIGPAMDGGYYLLGMNQYHPQVFEGIQWSTDTVLPVTLDRIRSLGRTCYLLPELSDIDHEADWKAHGWELA